MKQVWNSINLHSIRWRLPVTYAGIALLTTLALGVALLLPLRGYYQEQEHDYLRRNAQSIALAVAPILEAEGQPPDALREHIQLLSVLAQVRVRLLDAGQTALADSSAPSSAAPASIAFMRGPVASSTIEVTTSNVLIYSGTMPQPVRVEAAAKGANAGSANPAGTAWNQPLPAAMSESRWVTGPDGTAVPIVKVQQPLTGSVPADRLRFFYTGQPGQIGVQALEGEQAGALISVIPLSGTMYGFALQTEPDQAVARSVPRFAGPASGLVLRQPVTGSDGSLLGWVEVSQGPAYGREIVDNVARGWLLASLVAVLVAGSAGVWISRRMTAPLLALTEVTQRMAAGDLSARAALAQEDEFASLGQSFNEMAGRVEQTVQSLRRFVADAAHELHTPMTAIRTNLELAESAAGSINSESVKRLVEQVTRMQRLADDLLALSRIESPTLALLRELVDLCSLALLTCEPYASQAEQKEVDFQVDLPSWPVVVKGQRDQLQRAVANLVENALKFTPAGGQVTVSLEQVGQSACLRVTDNGIGIQAEDLPYLFQRFHRGRNAAAYPGSGLGLSIVQAVADRHGGTIRAESEAGGRTCFSLALPGEVQVE